MLKYGYLEVFQIVHLTSRYRESTVFVNLSRHALLCQKIFLTSIIVIISGPDIPKEITVERERERERARETERERAKLKNKHHETIPI